MTRARNIAGFSTITTTPSPVHVGPIGVLTATRIDGEFNQVDLATRNITAAGIAATNLQVSGITTGLNVSGIITAQNGINFNGTSTGLNVSGVGTIATLSVTGNATVGGVLTYEDVTRVDSVGVITAREQVHVGTGVSIAAGGLNVTAGISTFGGDVSIADKIIHTGDTNTAIRFPSADTFTVETGGSERLRIKSDGKVGISTDGPFSVLTAYGENRGEGTVTGQITAKDDADYNASPTAGLVFMGKYAANNAQAIFSGITGFKENANDGNLAGALAFHVRANGAVAYEALRITSAGTLKFTGQGTGLDTAAITHHTNNNLYIRGGTAGLILSNHDSTNVIHISNSDFIKFETTDGTERMRITGAGNVDINGTPPWTVTGGDYRNLSISGETASSAGFLWLGNGSAATNADFDLTRINICNGATITSSIRASTQTSANDDGRLTFHTKATGGSLTERMRIDSAGRVSIGNNTAQTAYPFYVATDLNSGGNLLNFGNTDSTYSQGLTLSFDSNKDMKWAGGSGSGGLIWDVGTRGFSFQIGSSEKLKVASGGDIGINVSSPGSRLAIYDADGDNLLLASHNYSGETRIGFTGNTGTGGTNVDGATTGALGVTASAPGGAATGYMSLYTNYGDSLQERLRLAAYGRPYFNSGKQTNFDNMAPNLVGNLTSFESTNGADASLNSGVIHHAVVARATGERTDSLFSFKGSGNCGFFAEVTAYFSAATVGTYQGRQRMWFRASRNGNANFQITQAHNYDKIGTSTTTHFNPIWGSSGSGSSQILTVKVTTTAMTNYIKIMYVTRFITMDSINTFTTLL